MSLNRTLFGQAFSWTSLTSSLTFVLKNRHGKLMGGLSFGCIHVPKTGRTAAVEGAGARAVGRYVGTHP